MFISVISSQCCVCLFFSYLGPSFAFVHTSDTPHTSYPVQYTFGREGRLLEFDHRYRIHNFGCPLSGYEGRRIVAIMHDTLE